MVNNIVRLVVNCKMEYSLRTNLYTFLLVCYVLLLVNGEPLVPALCIFGDSVVDVGNNNKLQTLIKANFPPYGRDFVTHKPTGRFCNGKLAADFTAEYLGFTSYPPAYLSKEAKRTFVRGVNFASASSGYYDKTAQLYKAVTLTQQLQHYRDWQKKVVKTKGKAKANAIFSGGIHIISAGSSDFVQNYYINPLLNRFYSPDQFSDILIKSYSVLIQKLYHLGARRIGVTSLPPIGCLPAAITLFGFGSGSNKCVARMNRDAVSFNKKLNITSHHLKAKLPGLKLVAFNIYQPLLDMILKPTDIGFFESRKACCGTGLLETSFLCNKGSIGTCSNATQYVFWDGFHPSQAANEKLAQSLLVQGLDLIS